MKKISVYLFSAILLFSCKKDDATPTVNIYDDVTKSYSLIDVSYGADSVQVMDLVLPANRNDSTTKLIVLIHGGAWAAGDKDDFKELVDSIKTDAMMKKYAVANVNYRLATLNGTFLWPTQIIDVEAAMNFINSNASKYHYNPNKIAILGASAGGQLALLKAYKTNTANRIKAVVDFFGPTDMIDLYNFQPLINQQGIGLLMGGTPQTATTVYNEASPKNYISTSSPATIIFHGTIDNLVPFTQSVSLDSALRAKNITSSFVPYPGEGHGFSKAKNDDAFRKMVTFLDKVLK